MKETKTHPSCQPLDTINLGVVSMFLVVLTEVLDSKLSGPPLLPIYFLLFF